MPPAGRLGDQSQVSADGHACPACPHPCVGPAIAGSPNVLVNAAPALRVGDTGVHAACCGPNMWTATEGAPTVFINGMAAHRLGDADGHCGGSGKLIQGSPDVIIGNSGGGGGGVGGPPSASKSMVLPGGVAVAALNPNGIAGAISNFSHGFRAGLASLLSSVTELAALYGLGKLVGLLDKLVDGLGTALKYFVWAVGKYLPGLKDLLRNLKAYTKTLFNYLLNFWDSMPANGACPAPQPTTAPLPVDDLVFSEEGEKLWEASSGSAGDVSLVAQRLLEAYRPVFVEAPEDIPAVAMEDLLPHATLVPPPKAGPTNPRTLHDYYTAVTTGYSDNPRADGDAHLDISDAAARGRVSYPQRTYYGRATTYSEEGSYSFPNRLRLEYFALRAGSYFANPYGYMDDDLWEHEGDGEGCAVILERKSKDDPWLLAGVQFSGSHYTQDCAKASGAKPGRAEATSGYKVPMETYAGRPVIYVAVGSHAMSGQAGKRRVPGLPAVDRYPDHTSASRVASYSLQTAASEEVHRAIFTKQIHWGKDGLWFTKVYGGKEYIPVATAVSEETADAFFA